MSETYRENVKRKRRLIDLAKPQEVTYWSKKWEISSPQLYQAYIQSGSNSVLKIESFLREKGWVN